MLYLVHMRGKVKSKKEIATGTLQVIFEVAEPFTFKAGQYCFITLRDLKYPDERGNRRHFSIVNSPNKKGIITFATRLTDSGFKKTLAELPVGTEVELGPVAGVFTLPEDTSKPLVFIAGGIGITPFMSMLSYVAEEKLPYKITLLYSNRDQNSTAFFTEVQSFDFIRLILIMAGEGRKIDADFIKEYFPSVNENLYMVVGPPPMVEAVQKSLTDAGVTNENIKIERFTGYQ
ncbi:MAG: oxidoreductase [Microgenomates group bacterium Gr01-1014_7]|nr:MAG: oxidoreductase [Microgenomates group bacterium Gr01-1014_7]